MLFTICVAYIKLYSNSATIKYPNKECYLCKNCTYLSIVCCRMYIQQKSLVISKITDVITNLE